MSQASRSVIKNLVVALALGLAAAATWSFTGSKPPAIELSSLSAQEG